MAARAVRLDFLSELPIEVAFAVATFLPCDALGKCAGVSKHWKSIAEDNHIWEDLWKRFFRNYKFASVSDADKRLMWATERGWKFGFKFTLADCDPNEFTKRTLCTETWTFKFRISHHGRLYPRFRDDLTFEDPWLHKMHWRFLDNTGEDVEGDWNTPLIHTLKQCLEMPSTAGKTMTELLAAYPQRRPAQNAIRFLQVDEFPPLEIMRPNANRWIIENRTGHFINLNAAEIKKLNERETIPEPFFVRYHRDEEEDRDMEEFDAMV